MFGSIENHAFGTIGSSEGEASDYFHSSSESCVEDSTSSFVTSDSLWAASVPSFPFLDVEPLPVCPSTVSNDSSDCLDTPEFLLESGEEHLFSSQGTELAGNPYLDNTSPLPHTPSIVGEEIAAIAAANSRRTSAQCFSDDHLELFAGSNEPQQPPLVSSPPLAVREPKESVVDPSLWQWNELAASKPASYESLLPCSLNEQTASRTVCHEEALYNRGPAAEYPDGDYIPAGAEQICFSAATYYPASARSGDDSAHGSYATDFSRRHDLYPRLHKSIDKNSQKNRGKAPQKPPTTAGISLGHLKDVFKFHRPEAERHLQLKRTTFSNLSRYYGISKWPFRTLRDADKRIEHNAEILSRPSTGREKRRKLEVQQRHLCAVKDLMYAEPHQSKDSNTIAVLLQIVAAREKSRVNNGRGPQSNM